MNPYILTWAERWPIKPTLLWCRVLANQEDSSLEVDDRRDEIDSMDVWLYEIGYN